MTFVLIAAVLTGCTFSKVNANATVVVSGRALTARGSPLAGVQVRLFKEADLGEALVGIVLAVGTLGTMCLLPAAPAICRRARVATTDAGGGYTFTLKGSDTQGLIGTEAALDLVAAAPGANGPSTTISFKARQTTVTLPDARLWNAIPRVSEGSGRVQLAWSSLPATAGRGAAYLAQLFDPTRQVPMWSQPESGTRADIDARVLEDHSASVAVAARTALTGGGTSDVHASYLSSRLAVQPIAGAPPSRRHPCRAVTGTATPASTPQTVCGVTDGNLVTPARLKAAKAQVVTGVAVDLGSVRPVDLVVARGVAGMVVVELSDDGATYHAAATSSESTVAVSPPGRPAARFVRVRSPSGLDESLMTELSVW
ncbi:MAG: LigA protein [Pseudonocardiales bacterium]|nr:LigA protein [Pseudonocardiales bacterium]